MGHQNKLMLRILIYDKLRRGNNTVSSRLSYMKPTAIVFFNCQPFTTVFLKEVKEKSGSRRNPCTTTLPKNNILKKKVIVFDSRDLNVSAPM